MRYEFFTIIFIIIVVRMMIAMERIALTRRHGMGIANTKFIEHKAVANPHTMQKRDVECGKKVNKKAVKNSSQICHF